MDEWPLSSAMASGESGSLRMSRASTPVSSSPSSSRADQPARIEHQDRYARSLAVTGTTITLLATTQKSAPLLHDAARQRQTAQAACRYAVPAPGGPGAVREAPDGHVAEALAPRGVVG